MEEKSKVYIRLDSENRIISCEGGYTMQNIDDISKWTLIDEGEGDKYNLCQSNYFEKPLTDDRGIYRYKYIDGEINERSQEEMDADYVQPEIIPTPEERLAIMEDAFAELCEVIFNG